MIDSVLKGTGNSRFLKSAVPAGTSWADALAMLQAGTFPIDFNGINTEGFQQVGTPLNKANLLKDATAAQIGLPPSTTPDGMFQALGNTGELHVWRKTVTSGTGTYSLGAVQEGLHYIKWANNSATSDSSGTFEYGSEIAVNNDGTITGIKNPSTITIKPWDDDASKANVFKGKFIKMISQVVTGLSRFGIGEIWWIPADAMMTKDLLNGQSDAWYIAASKRQQVIGVPAGTTTTYPVSTNPNAYQEGDDMKAAGYVVGDVVTGTFQLSPNPYMSNGVYYHTGTKLIVSDDGLVSVDTNDKSYNQVSFNTDSYYTDGIHAGRFIQLYGRSASGTPSSPNPNPPFNTIPSQVVYIPEGTSIVVASPTTIDRYQPVTGYAAIPANTTIEYLGKLGDKARVQVVSYVGTGTYGSSNPNSLTFDFVPKAVFVVGTQYSDGDGIAIMPMIYGYGFSNRELNDSNGNYCIVTWNKKTVTWYAYSSNAVFQSNSQGGKYFAVAIG